jgi:type IV secretion system protein VirB9
MKYTLFLFSAALLASCASVDIENRAKYRSSVSFNLDALDNIDENAAPLSEEEALIEKTVIGLRPETVILEKPVFIPESGEPPPPEPSGREAASAANASGTKAPSSSAFTAAALVYDYHPDWVYEVYASPSRVTDICLEENESPLEIPFVSDSDRWILGGGRSMSGGASVSHIYVKPKEAALTASMIINTDKRSYHILLRSFQETYMPIVRWQYKLYFPGDFFASQKNGPAAASNSPVEISHEIIAVDPRFLSFDYKIIYSLWDKPLWIPRLVYDDGRKTYISFSTGVLQSEFPAIFENRDDIVNYRVSGNLIVIDKLTKKVTLRLGSQKIIIEKKVK